MVDDIIEGQEVLKFRLSALESMLSGTEDIFGQSLIVDQIDLSNLSPVSLGILGYLVDEAPNRWMKLQSILLPHMKILICFGKLIVQKLEL